MLINQIQDEENTQEQYLKELSEQKSEIEQQKQEIEKFKKEYEVKVPDEDYLMKVR